MPSRARPWNEVRDLNGLLDVSAIAAVARNASWVGTEFNNQRPGSNFLTIGPEEDP